MPYNVNVPAPSGNQNQGWEQLVSWLISQSAKPADSTGSDVPAGTTYNPSDKTMNAPTGYPYGGLTNQQLYKGGGYRPVYPPAAQQGGSY